MKYFSESVLFLFAQFYAKFYLIELEELLLFESYLNYLSPFYSALSVRRCLFDYPSLLLIFFERFVLALCIKDSKALGLRFIISATSTCDFCSIL